MELVEIAPNILVNPDKIDSVEFSVVNGVKLFTVTVNGRQIMAQTDVGKLLVALMKCGVKENNQFFSV